ncbi:xanthine dehydrogenase family protein molybdopterin-binding subunit [Lentzea flaviverrucosa]|uniref:Isoquinoline 1-oxidoreductase, beta subunit n=1 Tax=Lentzea flaviverrucosa TaxID=200379 RepID=A0A1H8ZZN0_9PSEU|nr:molybdopterin cofactor-binding domain-containing protein [Lentzea flaviverrucosa]RDI32206.1 isoquinoline 1-oxidoreductase beta subunit [Lentzea flaviverrucosa]SEP69805.1 isoquinoline 1-oxidoreductase, beta subunit [Lentzea flaviverrucosa]
MISRRTLLRGAGIGALVVAVPVPALAAEGLVPNVFVRLDDAGRITATVPRPDTGQGVRTVVALMVAEELAVEAGDVTLEQAPGDTERFGSQAVANSTSVRQLSTPIRTAAATARCLLVTAAAQRWRVPVAECTARDGFVCHPRRGKLPYRALVRAAAALDPATVPVELTPPEKWRLLGKTRGGRVDARDVVTGRTRYGIDARPPGGLVAVVARPPWLGAVPDTIDDTATRALPGVVDVLTLTAPADGQGGVAVIARSTHQALRGRDALRITWRGGTPTADSRAWLADLRAALPAQAPIDGVQQVYSMPLLAHAPMEPMNATAHVRPDGVTIWAPTQDPGGLRTQLARQLGVPATSVRVEATASGGAFGRRIEPDPVLEAVACSRRAGAPVQVLWTRADDMRNDSYRPMSVHRLSAEIGSDGLPIRRAHEVVTWPLTVLPFFANPALIKASGDHFPYTVPGEVSVVVRPAPLRTGFWRAVYAGQFVYAEENFLSEIGRRSGLDQVALRRSLLPAGSRLHKVLDTVADRARWTRPPAPGTSRGVACLEEYGSAIAVIAVAEPGSREVLRVHAAVDVGVALHPSGVRAQVEGCVVDALSTVLGAQITVREGAVAESSFGDYRWARIGQTPDIDVTIVQSDAPLGGLGELAYPPAAAAIASAIAGDTPVTSMPFGTAVG